jgi:hypothetical protein
MKYIIFKEQLEELSKYTFDGFVTNDEVTKVTKLFAQIKKQVYPPDGQIELITYIKGVGE